MPALFMTELAVSDFAASVVWYRDRLGLRVILLDVANGFALLQGDAGGRLALKAGTPAPGGVTLHFEVADLAAELARLGPSGVPVRDSPEGYREAFVRDPDGYAVGLFEWVSMKTPPPNPLPRGERGDRRVPGPPSPPGGGG
ncbi:MAG: VOC family protein [Gemmataceae bacterium]|nr:VOC family protein [Gemmataceae bacterium]